MFTIVGRIVCPAKDFEGFSVTVEVLLMCHLIVKFSKFYVHLVYWYAYLSGGVEFWFIAVLGLVAIRVISEDFSSRLCVGGTCSISNKYGILF